MRGTREGEREGERKNERVHNLGIWGFEATNDFSAKGGEGRSVSNRESSSTEDGIFVVE